MAWWINQIPMQLIEIINSGEHCSGQEVQAVDTHLAERDALGSSDGLETQCGPLIWNASNSKLSFTVSSS